MGNQEYLIRDHDFQERLVNDGKSVYSIWWDSGNPGSGAGVESVYKLNGAYFVLIESESYPMGPYSTLLEAIKCTELDFIMSAVTDIDCTEMSDIQLAPELRSPNEEGYEVLINKERWMLDATGSFYQIEARHGYKEGKSE